MSPNINKVNFIKNPSDVTACIVPGNSFLFYLVSYVFFVSNSLSNIINIKQKIEIILSWQSIGYSFLPAKHI